jgi:hypothetical protein
MFVMRRKMCMSVLLSRCSKKGNTYALLHEVSDLSLILDLDQLLAAIGRVRDVQLHLGGVGGSTGGLVVGCCGRDVEIMKFEGWEKDFINFWCARQNLRRGPKLFRRVRT